MISRRGMLKTTLGISVGTIYQGSLISLLTGCGSDSSNSGHVEIHVGGLMVVDPTLCLSCRRCEIACVWNHEGGASPSLSRVKVLKNMNYGPHGVQANFEQQRGECGDKTIVPDTCRQCDVCIKVCPQTAISLNTETGAKIINQQLCIGCGYCVDKCPQHVMTLNINNNKAIKCDLCDGEPACAQVCPSGAIKFYTWEQAETALEQYEKFTAIL